jgi:hypothetical protein
MVLTDKNHQLTNLQEKKMNWPSFLDEENRPEVQLQQHQEFQLLEH